MKNNRAVSGLFFDLKEKPKPIKVEEPINPIEENQRNIKRLRELAVGFQEEEVRAVTEIFVKKHYKVIFEVLMEHHETLDTNLKSIAKLTGGEED